MAPSLPSRRRAARPSLAGRRSGAVRLRIRCSAADEEEAGAQRGEQVKAAVEEMAPGSDLVGLLTGASVVLFNLSVRGFKYNRSLAMSFNSNSDNPGPLGQPHLQEDPRLCPFDKLTHLLFLSHQMLDDLGAAGVRSK